MAFSKVFLCGVIVLLSLVSLLSAKPFDSSEVWDRYRAELIRFFSQGTNDDMKNLQLVSNPIPVEWNENPEQFQMFANSRMEPGSTWQLDMRTFSSLYEEFITSLKGSSTPRSNAKLEALYDQEAEKLESYQMDLGRCFMNYEAMNPNIRPTFDMFKNSMCWSLQRSYSEYLRLRAQIEVAGRRTYGSDKEYRLVKALGKYSSAPKRDFIEVTTLADFVRRNNMGKYNSFELSLSDSTSANRGESSWSSFSLNIGVPGFFSLGYNSNKKNMKMTTNKKDFNMKFGAQSWTAIRVLPDPKWFSGSVIQEWAKGPFKAKGEKYFFGSKGKMTMVPQTFFVVSKPHVEMTLNKDDFEQMEKAKSSGFSLSVGGLAFNFNKAKTSSNKDTKNDLFRFRIEGNDETPQLIAVKGDNLPF